ncbi:hypothetical protein AC249_AIPGENE402 [Exaiptasia diaphana]|nr:hypothetical protein AC249_AIPGENE402 [Exaiptasia diaphana]
MADVDQRIRVYLQDLTRWLDSGNLDSDNLDCLSFRLDWLLNVLVRYSGTGRLDNLSGVVDILRNATQELEIINDDREGAPLQALPVFTGRRGKPKINIPKEHLEFFIERRFNVSNIAKILGVSKRTVERRMHELNIRIRSSYSTISDEALVETIKSILSYENCVKQWYCFHASPQILEVDFNVLILLFSMELGYYSVFDS